MVSRGVFEDVYISLQVCYVRCCCSGWFMELAFALQEKNPCRWFPRKVAVMCPCLYSPSTSKMSDIGILCARVRLPASNVDSLTRVPLGSVGL